MAKRKKNNMTNNYLQNTSQKTNLSTNPTQIIELRCSVWISSSCSTGDTSRVAVKIRVITKLPNSEQSYKGKVKTHKYINRKNQSTTGKL